MFDLEIITLLNWACTLIGVKYVWVCNSEYMMINHIPMYGTLNVLPDINFIKLHGCNCVGLINLLRLKNNKNIPGHNNKKFIQSNYIGSLGVWINELKKSNFLSKYNKDLSYEIGTLLIKASNYNTFGHMAIIIGHNKILHSYTNYNGKFSELCNTASYQDIFTDPGICISNIDNYLFEYTCKPSIWLYQDF